MISADLLEFRNITKRFGNFVANDSLSFCVGRGSLHAIVGENGAGKSTAMNLFFGILQPDSGEFFLDGKSHKPQNPQEAVAQGVAMVHQHFMLNVEETALDNFIQSAVGFAQKSAFSPFAMLNREKYDLRLQQVSKDSFGSPFPSSVLVKNLSMGERQRLEILKALALECRVLILDEPTAVLSVEESALLYEQLKVLKDKNGLTILIITHKLKEVCAHADKATVLRKAQVVAEFDRRELNTSQLAEAMTGAVLVSCRRPRDPRSEVIVKAKNLMVLSDKKKQSLGPLDLEISSGEILGIAGVEGNGQSDLLWALADPSRLRNQRKNVSSDLLVVPKSTAFVPEDRHKDAMCPDLTAAENLILGREKSFSKLGFLVRGTLSAHAQGVFESFDVRPQKPNLPIGQFSGGNQQKIVVARELHKEPQFLMVAHPTRGVDVSAAQTLRQKIVSQAEKGAAVLVVSSDLEELFEICHTLFVLYEGRLLGPFSHPFSEALVGKAMGGVI